MSLEREVISEVIHNEWLRWAQTILLTEPNITPERVSRWKNECFMPYKDLSEEQKEMDRMFADKFIKALESIPMNDRYLNTEETYKRLKRESEQYPHLFIAFDFDNTVFDYHQVGDTFPLVENLLVLAKIQGHKLILFTGNEGDKLTGIIQYCIDRGYGPDYVNENPIMDTRKPYYNILLDDRAGLKESYEILKKVLYGI